MDSGAETGKSDDDSVFSMVIGVLGGLVLVACVTIAALALRRRRGHQDGRQSKKGKDKKDQDGPRKMRVEKKDEHKGNSNEREEKVVKGKQSKNPEKRHEEVVNVDPKKIEAKGGGNSLLLKSPIGEMQASGETSPGPGGQWRGINLRPTLPSAMSETYV